MVSFTPTQSPAACWTRSWLSPTAVLDGVQKKILPSLCLEWDRDFSLFDLLT